MTMVATFLAGAINILLKNVVLANNILRKNSGGPPIYAASPFLQNFRNGIRCKCFAVTFYA